jgi:plasmid stabilization system protein ParE
MGEIKWTEKSSSNLQAIFDYIDKNSKFYAARFIKSLVASTKKLEAMPRCGRMIPELEEQGLREIIFRNYRIAYRIKKNDAVEILAVIHGARDFLSAFEE